MVFLQTTTVTVTPGKDPVNVPVPPNEPIKEVEITVTTTRDGEEQPVPPTVKVNVKGCLKGKFLLRVKHGNK